MTEILDIHPLDDRFVAMLDGQLTPDEERELQREIGHDAALAARFAAMAAGGDAARTAFKVLPAMPEHLEGWLTAAIEKDLAPIPLRRAAVPVRWIAALAATLFVGIGIGIYAGRLGAPDEVADSRAESTADWREAVAEYLTLYTAETFANLPSDPALHERQLASLGARLGVNLSLGTVALPEMTLRRAQMFDYDGNALGQIAYTDAADVPVALCIIDQKMPDAGLQAEQRHGVNIVYWSKDGRSYLLASRLPTERLETMAANVARRIDG